MSEPVEPAAGRCAICGQPQDAKFRPFCSKRCADVDLGRWLKGNYVIPGRESELFDPQKINDDPDNDTES